ncbi:hypothetical protein BU26DRAFT_442433 [Trematosphaeria pertusa]|uniref:Uncharacterized protein n=1 Tax=Trematosphaeria pertusa TaxID=390896 RepID=A0A6A6HQQ0_9PLEO|nr:uncharacterized protein BU26DRAFT_442433 [Trematosphaeria pertusa]KAF2240465.1 hypothetical protein BU26DRAFT_442433 [Trematosphaeria pertusa]
MSGDSLPITAERFAKALADLSLSSLYLKVAELENSIAHLQKSNGELQEFVRQEEDKECYEAILENRDVIRRMEERIELVKREVTEVRGLPFKPRGEEKSAPVDAESRTNGATNGTAEMAGAAARNGTNASNGTTHGQQAGNAAEEEEGVFL